MSPAGFKHGTIVARLTGALVQHVEAHDLGEVTGAETGFKLASNPDTVRVSDVGFVRRERIPAGELTEKFWPGAPDLAVEVVSPNDTLYEVDDKVEDYLAAGVRLVWIVNPKKRTVTVHQPNSEPQTLGERRRVGRAGFSIQRRQAVCGQALISFS
jgi:Uma2 family endonuclease